MLRVLFRAALAAGTAAAVGEAAACASLGGGEDFGSAVPETDAAYPPAMDSSLADGAEGSDAYVPVDAGSVDAPATGEDGGAPDAAQMPTSIVFVHASPSPDVTSLRLCWSDTQEPFPANNEMPASNYPGIPAGGAVWLADASDVTQRAGATVYALRASRVADEDRTAPGLPCSELVCQGGAHCLTRFLDYWPVGTIPPGALRQGTVNIVAVAGCINSDPLATKARCGQDFDAAVPGGNLHLEFLPLDGGAADDAGGPLIVQVAQLSVGLQSVQGDAGKTRISFGSEADAALVVDLAHEGELLPSPPAQLFLPGGLASFGQVGFGVDVLGVDAGGAGHLWMSLAQAQQLVDPAQDPRVYYAGGPYVVAVLGDPYAAHAFGGGDGGYDGHGLHVLLLPTASGASP